MSEIKKSGKLENLSSVRKSDGKGRIGGFRPGARYCVQGDRGGECWIEKGGHSLEGELHSVDVTADTKGRIGGFPQSSVFAVSGSVNMTRLELLFNRYDFATPVRGAAEDYLALFGLNPSLFRVDGTSQYGVFMFASDPRRPGSRLYGEDNRPVVVWSRWPDGFDYWEFVRLSLLP